MEIVIKIEEELYNTIMCTPTSPVLGWHEIAHGTVLPKGHGRLIEDNEVLFQSIRDYCGPGKAYEILKESKTIIEADKENKRSSDNLPSCNNCVHNGERASTGNCIKCSGFDRYERSGR